jgi:hypothetical protein
MIFSKTRFPLFGIIHAGAGLDPHEHEILPPTGMDRKTSDAGDFHAAANCDRAT